MKHGVIWKLFSILRFLYFKVRYANAFKFCSTGIIGRNTHLFLGYSCSKVQIGKRIILANDVEILCKGSLTIGSNLSMNEYSRIVAHHNIQLGEHVTIARFVSILDHDHHCEVINGKMQMSGYDVDDVIIGDHVWIGDKVTILKGTKIGSNVIIASNSVVKGELDSFGVYGGIPAKKLKDLR
jgi:acetyltransferase-like isoleucine patch superfamily enzyme